MSSPDDQRLSDEENGIENPASPYKYTSPEKAAASIDVRNKVLSALAGGDVTKAATANEQDEKIDTRTFEEQLSEARVQYERLCREYGLQEFTIEEYRQALDEYYGLMARIPDEINEYTVCYKLYEQYEQLPRVAQRRVLEILREKNAPIDETWIPQIFVNDFDEGVRIVKEKLRTRKMDEPQACATLRCAGALSVPLSRRLLAAFPKLLTKYTAKRQWGYEPQAFDGLSEWEILAVLREEEAKEPWDFFITRTVEALLRNTNTPESLLRVVKRYVETNPELYPESDILRALKDTFTFGEPSDAKPAWVKAWARELHDRSNAFEKMPRYYLEDVDALEEFPEFPRIIARLRAQPFFQDERRIERVIRSISVEFLLALEEMDYNADSATIAAYLESKGFDRSRWRDLTKVRILVECLTGHEPTFIDAMLGDDPLFVGDGMDEFIVTYVMSLEPTKDECMRVLAEAAKDRNILENIARSTLVEKLLHLVPEQDTRDSLLKAMILCAAASSDSRETGYIILRCLRLLSRKEARDMARTLSMLPIAPTIQLEEIFFQEAYEDVLDAQADKEKRSSTVEKMHFPAMRILRRAVERTSRGELAVIPPTDADALRIADAYANAVAAAKEEDKRRAKKESAVSNLFTKIASYFSRATHDAAHSPPAPRPRIQRPERVAPLAAIAEQPHVGKLESFPDFVGRIDWTPRGHNSYLFLGFIDIEEGMAGEQRETNDETVLDALHSPTRMPLENGYEHELLLYGTRPGAVLPLPLRSTGIRAADEHGNPLRLSFERDGRPRLENDTPLENVRVKLQLPKKNEEPTLPDGMTIDELRAAMPPALAPYAVPKLRPDLLPAALSDAVARAKGEPAATAIETLRDAVRNHMQYDDRAQKDYEDIVGTDASGRDAYLERIIEKKRGVCGQFSALYAELLRQAGIPCVEANVLMVTQANVTENDYHRTTTIPCPRADGGVEPMIKDPTGRDYILRALLRQLCEVVRIPPVTRALENFADDAPPSLDDAEERPEDPVPVEAWKHTLPVGLEDVDLPSQVRPSDIRELARDIGLDTSGSLHGIVQALFDRCIHDLGAFDTPTGTPERAELQRFFLALKNAAERRFAQEFDASDPDFLGAATKV